MENYSEFNLNEYIDKLKNIETNAKRDKYNKIKYILEQIFMIECKSLTEYPPIYLDKIISDDHYIKKIINNNYKTIAEIFNGNVTEIMNLTDENNYTCIYLQDQDQDQDNSKHILQKNVLAFVRRLLEKINYSLVLRKINTREYYVIKCNKS